jgi:hypothetical protein
MLKHPWRANGWNCSRVIKNSVSAAIKEIDLKTSRTAVVFDPKTSPGGGAYYLRLIEGAARLNIYFCHETRPWMDGEPEGMSFINQGVRRSTERRMEWFGSSGYVDAVSASGRFPWSYSGERGGGNSSGQVAACKESLECALPVTGEFYTSISSRDRYDTSKVSTAPAQHPRTHLLAAPAPGVQIDRNSGEI